VRGAWDAFARGRMGRAMLAALVLGSVMAACGDDDDDGAQALTRAEPTAGGWHTWILTSPGDVNVPPPPSKGSAQAKSELDEVKGEARNRTPAVIDTINKWSTPLPTDPWMIQVFDFVSKSEKNPPLSSRNYALVAVAMHDAVVAAYHWKYRYDVDPPSGVDRAVTISRDPSYPSEHAAMAGAASKVLAHLYPNQPALRLDEMAEEAARSRVQAGTNTPGDARAGLELGRGVAEKVIEYAKHDGADKPWDGRRPAGIGRGPAYWEPPPGSISPPTAPVAGAWKTFTLTANNQFRPPPPPAYNSPEFRASAQRLLDVQRNLTPEQQKIAKFWEGAEGTPLPAGIVNQVYNTDLREKATLADAHRRWTVPQLTRAVAMLNVAMSDGGISVWDAKFTYWNPRPENGIRDMGLDRNFKPHLPTPRFPAYPSGTAGYAGSAEAVMAYLIPEKAGEFERRAEEQAVSRQYAGIHWDYDAVSLDGGRQIGQLVIDKVKDDTINGNNGR
jgi:membrane-associated phospholipid phosphatase